MGLAQALDETLNDYNNGKVTFKMTACKLIELAEDDADDGIVDYGEEEENEVITCMFLDLNCQYIINYTDKTIVKQ